MGSIANVLSKVDINSISFNKPQEIALIGLGAWAEKAIIPTLSDQRFFSFIKQLHIVSVDLKETHVKDIPNLNVTTYQSDGYQHVLSDANIKAVIIASPDVTHYELCKQALNAGKHVFVEKAFVLSSSQAFELVNLAKSKNVVLMVGYEFMYDERFTALAKLVDSGKMGHVESLRCYLMNPADVGESYADTSIIEHHTTHQLSMLQLLLGIHNVEHLNIQEAQESFVRLDFMYQDTHVYFTTAVGYSKGCNLRKIEVTGGRLKVRLDYGAGDAKFSVYDARSFEEIAPDSDDYPEEFRRLENKSSVTNELATFFKCIERRESAVSGGANAVHLVQMAEFINDKFISTYVTRKERVRSENEAYQREFHARLDRISDDENFTPDDYAKFYDQGIKVVNSLRDKPYAYASDIADSVGLDRQELKVIYKAIQSSPLAQKQLRNGVNYDYFGVADSFFNHQNFEATFFVGIVCPYKCTFCKMQMTALPVHPETERFTHKRSDLMTLDEIDSAINDLYELKQTGKNVTVKISGGLEPLSDIQRVSYIIHRAKKKRLPVRLYTNGVLINNGKVRRTLLQLNDIRISLNTVNEEKYRRVYLNDSAGRKSQFSLNRLYARIEALIQNRKKLNSTTKVGFNFVVIRDTIIDMAELANVARSLGLDYINYNIDYSDNFSAEEFAEIEENIAYIKFLAASGKLGTLHVNFGGSLLAHNVFTQKPNGTLDPTDISEYKVFIEPGGYVTPIHEGTFAYRTMEYEVQDNPYSLGTISEHSYLSGMLKNRRQLDPVGYEYLAPFELILALEMLREKADRQYGIDAEYSPYRTLMADSLIME